VALVVLQDLLEFVGVGGRMRDDDVALDLLVVRPAVDVPVEDAVDESPDFGVVAEVEVGHPEDGSLLELAAALLCGVADDLELGRLIELHIFLPLALVLLLFVVDLLCAVAFVPEVLELAIGIPEIEEILLVRRFALLLACRIGLVLAVVGNEAPPDLLVDDLLHVGVLGVILVLLEDLHQPN
jgi:hypothetical protein